MLRKSWFLLLVFFVVNCESFSENWYSSLEKNFVNRTSLRLGAFEMGYSYERIGDIIRVYGSPDTKRKDTYDLRITDFKLNTKTGFVECMIDGFICNVVLGDQYLFIFGGDELLGTGIGMSDLRDYDIKSESSFELLKNEYYKNSAFLSNNITSVVVSSFLSEKSNNREIKYTGIEIEKYLLFKSFHNGVNPFFVPWVEGKKGEGINEWIEIELAVPQDNIYVLNGYVDPKRPSLFMMNNKVRNAEIIGYTEDEREFKKEVLFLDMAYFHTITFSEPIVRARLHIKSVYPGTKWNDTVVSAIMCPQ